MPQQRKKSLAIFHHTSNAVGHSECFWSSVSSTEILEFSAHDTVDQTIESECLCLCAKFCFAFRRKGKDSPTEAQHLAQRSTLTLFMGYDLTLLCDVKWNQKCNVYGIWSRGKVRSKIRIEKSKQLIAVPLAHVRKVRCDWILTYICEYGNINNNSI